MSGFKGRPKQFRIEAEDDVEDKYGDDGAYTMIGMTYTGSGGSVAGVVVGEARASEDKIHWSGK